MKVAAVLLTKAFHEFQVPLALLIIVETSATVITALNYVQATSGGVVT
jgi:hypothetical protein